MKKYTSPFAVYASFALLTISAVCQAETQLTGWELDYKLLYHKREHADCILPRFAWVADIVGIGRVTNAFDTEIITGREPLQDGFVDIEIDTFWRGDPGTNNFRVVGRFGAQPPVTNTPVLFLLTKYSWFYNNKNRSRKQTPGIRMETSPIFDMEYFRANETPDGLWFCHDVASWFNVNEKNADIFAFTSNLVFAVNSNNTNEFYRILRDVCIGEPEDTRVYIDSHVALSQAPVFFTTDFIQRFWNRDPAARDLPSMVRRSIVGHVYSLYKIDLNAKPETVILVR